MVILHDVIKTIQNGVFTFSLKKDQILLSLKKTFFLNNPKNRWVGFFEKKVFLNPAADR